MFDKVYKVVLIEQVDSFYFIRFVRNISDNVSEHNLILSIEFFF